MTGNTDCFEDAGYKRGSFPFSVLQCVCVQSVYIIGCKLINKRNACTCGRLKTLDRNDCIWRSYVLQECLIYYPLNESVAKTSNIIL